MKTDMNYAKMESKALSQLSWMYKNTGSVPIEGEIYIEIDKIRYCVQFEERGKGHFVITGYKSV